MKETRLAGAGPRWRKLALLTGLTAVIFLAVTDVIGRLYVWVEWTGVELEVDRDPGLLYTNHRNLISQGGDGVGPHNSLSGRGAEPNTTAPRRVLVLGDSVAYGLGVDHRHTFAHLLEEGLDAQVPTSVLNVGTIAYNTWQELRMWERTAPLFRPTHAVLQISINDRDDGMTPVAHDVIATHRQGRLYDSDRSWLYRWSGLAHAISLTRRQTQPIELGPIPAYDTRPLAWRTEWEVVFDRLLSRMMRVTRCVVVFAAPVLEDPDSSNPRVIADRAAIAAARERGVLVLDGAALLGAHADPAAFYLPGNNVHLNEAGNRVVAEGLVALLRDGCASGQPST